MRVIHGDALEVMRSMPSESYDIVVTSPPYNFGMKPGSTSLWKKSVREGGLCHGYDGHSDDMPEDEYIAWQNECIKEMLRLVKDGGAVFYNTKWRIQDGVLQDRKGILDGITLRQVIIWRRIGRLNFTDTFFVPTYEVIYLLPKGNFHLQPKANIMTDVWDMWPDYHNDHPAPFPVELPLNCIKASGAKKILDPFGGSGTTAVAAKMLGADCDLIEQSEVYCKMAEERIAKTAPPVTLDAFADEGERRHGQDRRRADGFDKQDARRARGGRHDGCCGQHDRRHGDARTSGRA